MEEVALEGSKVVGKLKEDVRDKVREELTVLQMEALYKQVKENFFYTAGVVYLPISRALPRNYQRGRRWYQVQNLRGLGSRKSRQD